MVRIASSEISTTSQSQLNNYM